ncbi:MAG: hypothetical protein C0514_00630 [Candidatus Puniceispirillum sp.]|nr:hypothetical protein [Candidatus Puniceispirillum sp.]
MKERAHRFALKISFIFEGVVQRIKAAFRALRIFHAEHNWHLSKKGNFYNPILEATIFRSQGYWKIARHDEYFGQFETAQVAQAYALRMWMREQNLLQLPGKSPLRQDESRVGGKDMVTEDAYCEDAVDYKIYKREANENLKAEFFYLAQTGKDCYRCRIRTPVYAIILPEGFEAVDEYAIEDLEEEGVVVDEYIPFSAQDYCSLVSYVDYISPSALREIYKHTGERSFCMEYSHTIKASYYRSICYACGAAQGDHFISSKLNTPFCPSHFEDFKKIRFYTIHEKISLRARTYTIDHPFMEDGFLENVA